MPFLTTPASLKPVLYAAGFASILCMSACQSTPRTLYAEMGGQTKIAEVTDNFIEEISFNPHIIRYFENSNIDRFRDKLNEHLCMLSDGPCQYTGDSMLDVHKGMNISEAHFTLTVELLINAMNKAKITHTTQNKIIARLAPMRADIIYK